MKIGMEKKAELPLEIRSNNPGSGSGSVTIEQCHRIRYGKLVYISARAKITQNISSDARDTALLLLDIRPKEESNYVPSFLKVNDVPWADLVRIRYFSSTGQYYAQQMVATTLSQGTTVEMFFVYEADQ